VLGFALYFETRRVRDHSWWWFFRGGLAVCMIITAAILKIVANLKEYKDDSTVQTDAYGLQHAFWHVLLGLAQFLFATMLDDLVNSAFGWKAQPSKYAAVSVSKI
jgi:CDP-diglyceride synthetase